jgi:hypothetical protein
MEKNIGLLVGLISVLGVLSLITLFIAGSGKIDQQALSDKITAQVISKIPAPEKVPTAAEIAAQIVVPSAPEVIIPEFKENEKVNDLWKNLYADQIEELETEAYNVAELELKDHDYKLLTNWLEANVVGFDEIDSVTIKDYDINVVELGLDEDEDKIATVNFELKVRYTLLEGSDDNLKKTVNATATVNFDKGDFSDEDVELVFA